MASVALIGPDGAGKTTICQMLEASWLPPIKYLYMGVSIGSSNRALLTSRLVEFLKRKLHGKSGEAGRKDGALPGQVKGKRRTHGKLWAAARLANRLADEWYRQLLSWSFQSRGYIVLYDRHFVFDFDEHITAGAQEPLGKRLHRWCLAHFYPRPDLVIYLDAPGAVLFARKGELTVEELERRRQGFIRQGNRVPNFVQIDATQPLADVFAEVVDHIRRFGKSRPGQAIPEDQLETRAGIVP